MKDLKYKMNIIKPVRTYKNVKQEINFPRKSGVYI